MAAEAAFCAQCGTPAPGGAPPIMPPTMQGAPLAPQMPSEKIHWGWWALPVLLSWIGGLIAFFVLRERNKKTATTMLIVGFVMVIVWSIVVVMAATAYVLVSGGFTEPGMYGTSFTVDQAFCEPATSSTVGRAGFDVLEVMPGFPAGDLIAYDGDRGPRSGAFLIGGAGGDIAPGDVLTLSPAPGASIGCSETVFFVDARTDEIVAVAQLHS